MNIAHLPPKYKPKLHSYRSATNCEKCGITAAYEDAHPSNPCFQCGSMPLVEVIARWIPDPRGWKFWKPKTGHWKIKDRVPTPKTPPINKPHCILTECLEGGFILNVYLCSNLNDPKNRTRVLLSLTPDVKTWPEVLRDAALAIETNSGPLISHA